MRDDIIIIIIIIGEDASPGPAQPRPAQASLGQPSPARLYCRLSRNAVAQPQLVARLFLLVGADVNSSCNGGSGGGGGGGGERHTHQWLNNNSEQSFFLIHSPLLSRSTPGLAHSAVKSYQTRRFLSSPLSNCLKTDNRWRTTDWKPLEARHSMLVLIHLVHV